MTRKELNDRKFASAISKSEHFLGVFSTCADDMLYYSRSDDSIHAVVESVDILLDILSDRISSLRILD